MGRLELMYTVKKKWATSTVYVNLNPSYVKPVPGLPRKAIIYLGEATQEQLSLLAALKHPAVEKSKK